MQAERKNIVEGTGRERRGGHLIHVKGARVLGVGADLKRVAVI